MKEQENVTPNFLIYFSNQKHITYQKEQKRELTTQEYLCVFLVCLKHKTKPSIYRLQMRSTCQQLGSNLPIFSSCKIFINLPYLCKYLIRFHMGEFIESQQHVVYPNMSHKLTNLHLGEYQFFNPVVNHRWWSIKPIFNFSQH